MNKILKTVVLLAAVTVLAAVPFASYASQSLDDVNEKKDQAEEQLEQGKQRQNDLLSQIDEVNAQMKDLENEISGYDSRIDEQEEKIEKAREALNEKEEEIGGQNDALGERLRVMYKSGDTGMLEVLLGSSDISELISNMDMFQKIYENDAGILKDMEKQYDEISERKDKLVSLKDELKKQQGEKKQSQSELESKSAELEKLEARVADDNEALEEQIDSLNQEAARITDEIQQGQLAASSSADSTYTSGDETSGSMLWPVPSSHRITSEYGNRFHPILKTNKFHAGIDIGASTGEQILAANDGTVIFAGTKGGYGNCVMVDHGGGVVTLYGHCSKLLVDSGQQVKRGENIALVGSTGQSTGPHCHFEVRVNGSTTDPTNFLQ